MQPHFYFRIKFCGTNYVYGVNFNKIGQKKFFDRANRELTLVIGKAKKVFFRNFSPKKILPQILFQNDHLWHSTRMWCDFELNRTKIKCVLNRFCDELTLVIEVVFSQYFPQKKSQPHFYFRNPFCGSRHICGVNFIQIG